MPPTRLEERSLTSSDSRDGALARLADAMFMHRKKVLLGWVVILAVAIVGGPSLAGTYTVDYSTPGSDSKAASDRLVQKFAGRSGESVDIVWKASGGANRARSHRTHRSAPGGGRDRPRHRSGDHRRRCRGLARRPD